MQKVTANVFMRYVNKKQNVHEVEREGTNYLFCRVINRFDD